jgi:hypothetical protein
VVVKHVDWIVCPIMVCEGNNCSEVVISGCD